MNKTHKISPDDQSLWSAFRQGDEYAFGEIASRYYQSLYTYGARFSADREFVKDCMQELFIEMWERRETLGDTDFVKFYLFKSIRTSTPKQLLWVCVGTASRTSRKRRLQWVSILNSDRNMKSMKNILGVSQ